MTTSQLKVLYLTLLCSLEKAKKGQKGNENGEEEVATGIEKLKELKRKK